MSKNHRINARLGIALLIIVLVMPLACGLPSSPPTASGPLGLQQVDGLMSEAMLGSIAYNVPASMRLNETTHIQVLISPSLSEDDLQKRIRASGPVASAQISVTTRMKAELRTSDPDAFDILALHDNAEQLLSTVEPTEWTWSVRARKGGQQTLFLTVYRLIEYAGKENWRTVKSYESHIQVTVTLPQRLGQFDWRWPAVLLAFLLLGLIIVWAITRLRRPVLATDLTAGQRLPSLSKESAKLHHDLAERFNKEELRSLCFDLGIRDENLAADTLDGMARELVAYCERTGQIPDLVARCRELRPHVSWEGGGD